MRVKPALAIALACLLVTLARQGASAADVVSVTCDFDAPQFHTVDGNTRITVPGCDTLQRADAPVLPFRTLKVLLPPATSVKEIRVTNLAKPVKIEGSWTVEHGRIPVPSMTRKSTTPEKTAVRNEAIYASTNACPNTAAELITVQQMGGHAIAFIRVYPVQYRPLPGEIVLKPRLQVEVALDQAALSGVRAPGRAARMRVARFVDNPDVLAEYSVEAPAPLQFSSTGTFDYLLITRSNLIPAFTPLLQRKSMNGLSVTAETVETIVATQPGRDGAEKIRNFIRFAYANWGITYVLLGGDVATVPCRYAHVYMGSLTPDHRVPSDLYFACLDGSWDGNENNQFGEPTDGEGGGDVDLLAEVCVGRAPVDTPEEVAAFVEKTIRYQETAPPDAGQVLLAATYLGFFAPGVDAQGGDMFDPMLPALSGFSISWLDDRPQTLARWGAADALNALNSSPHFALYNGHGDTDSVLRLETADLNALTNQHSFLACSVGCNAGQFDNDPFSHDSIGEALVKKGFSGAFAGLFNSREGWFDPVDEWRYSGEFQAQFFDHLLNQGDTTLGAASQFSRHDLLGQVETSGIMPYRWCYYEINLFGDPHASIRQPLQPLRIVSAHGSTVPSPGTNWFLRGSIVTCGPGSNNVSGTTGTRYLCTGWSGEGSVAQTGTEMEVTFMITNDSQLTWNWATQFSLTVSPAEHGTVTGDPGWHAAGTSTHLVATASNYFHFAGWQTGVPPNLNSNATVSLIMDQPRTVAASFAENLTSQGTPEWWLASFNWTNDFEIAAAADQDSDGMPSWQEHVAGTIPVDAASVLRVSRVLYDHRQNRITLEWPGIARRTYQIHAASSLDQGAWTAIATNIVATPPLNWFTLGSSNAESYYRVTVQITR